MKHAGIVFRHLSPTALTSMLMFAIGIGATSAVFSVVYTVLLKPLPFPEFERLVAIPQMDLRDGTRTSTSMPDYVSFRNAVGTFESIAAFGRSTFTLRGETQVLPEQIPGSFVTDQFFSTLGVTAAKGRTFFSTDLDGSIILSNGIWIRVFHGDPAIIGKTVLLDGLPVSVIGVMPPEFWYPSAAVQVWRLLRSDSPTLHGTEDLRFLFLFGRLRSRATLPQAQAELDVLNKQLAIARPDMNTNLGVSVLSLADQITMSLRPTLSVLMVCVIFVLLIAIGNAVNLQLVRMIDRAKEFAIRAAHGATWIHIFWLLLQENLLVSLAGGILGSGFAILGVVFSLKFYPIVVPRSAEVGINGTVFAFTLTITALMAVLCVVISMAAISVPVLLSSLNCQDERATSGKRARLLQASLVIVEVASALILMIAVTLMTKSLARLSSVDVGFAPERLLMVSVQLQKVHYIKLADLNSFRTEIETRVSQTPGVEAVASSSDRPLVSFFENFFSIKGKEVPASDREMVAECSVSAGYFSMMGIQLREGREFTEFDGPTTQRVAVINESMARRYWPTHSPLGGQIRHGLPDEPTEWYTIVGVVNDVVPVVGYRPVRTIYTVFAQTPEGYDEFLNRRTTFLVRAKGHAERGLVNEIRVRLAGLDPDLGTEIQSINQVVSNSLVQPSFRAKMFGIFGLTGFVLSVVGIYAVISTSIASETRSIAIRIVLGANPRHLLFRALARGMALAGVGLVLGLGASLLLSRFVRSLLFEVSPTDPSSISGAIFVLACAAMVAIYVPARRSTKIDPAISLRRL